MSSRINFLCRSCGKENVHSTGEEWQGSRCEHCGAELRLAPSPSLQKGGPIDTCAVCGRDLFFVQKDFNRALGCAVLAAGAVTSVFTYGLSLVAAAAVDWVLYYRLPEVTVCYFCNSLYRGFAPNPKHRGYDLNIGELVEGAVRGEK